MNEKTKAIYIPVSLHREIKKAAAAHGISIGKFIVSTLYIELQELDLDGAIARETKELREKMGIKCN